MNIIEAIIDSMTCRQKKQLLKKIYNEWKIDSTDSHIRFEEQNRDDLEFSVCKWVPDKRLLQEIRKCQTGILSRRSQSP